MATRPLRPIPIGSRARPIRRHGAAHAQSPPPALPWRRGGPRGARAGHAPFTIHHHPLRPSARPRPPAPGSPMAPPWPPLALGLLFFPGLFLLARALLRRRCPEPHAVILAARLVSSVQAVMASTAGFIIASSCQHVIDDEHWLAEAYPAFAVPYFLYDVYAMFLCHRHRACVKGHETAPAPPPRAAAVAFLRREPLLVLHHVTMVLVCFPVAC
ncbi:ceramide synthase-like, partial [Pezoporus occidentalis]|uniref:ceramide synthase-like n=1 Tax=Pezoporus occidentalis TaxID=407982 RepID=UPI002F9067AF